MTGSDGAKPRRPRDLAFPLRLVVGAGFGVIVVLTIAQVIFRFVFDSPLVWSEELARLLLVWVTFLGGAVVCWDGAHLSVDALFVKLPRPLRRYVRIFNGAVAIVFLVVLTYFSIEMVIIEHITTLGSMDIPASFVRVPATIGGALMIIFIVLRWTYRLPAERAAMGEAFDDSEEPM